MEQNEETILFKILNARVINGCVRTLMVFDEGEVHMK